ncbi:hypothetical protein N0V90_003724 [Kalmusia sp. IMI 367209]|nr:hypothetical protein N0V90_003724 [Kalmusia sp. IMI 367209]
MWPQQRRSGVRKSMDLRLVQKPLEMLRSKPPWAVEMARIGLDQAALQTWGKTESTGTFPGYLRNIWRFRYRFGLEKGMLVNVVENLNWICADKVS